MAEVYKTGKSNIKNILAGILLIGGILIAAFANQWAIREHLVGFTSRTWPDRNYHRIHFTRDGGLVGTLVDGHRLIVERHARSGSETGKWVINTGRQLSTADLQTEWVVDKEAQRVAYVATPESIRVRPLCESGSAGCAGREIGLPVATRSLLAFSFVPGRMLAAVFEDNSVVLWDTETGNEVGRLSAPLQGADQARWETDYLSMASASSRSAKVFRLTEGPQLKLIEESKTPMPPYRLLMPGTGAVGYLSSGGMYYRGGTRNSPGTVRSATVGGNDMLVAAGDFDGFYVLAAKEDPYPLLEGEDSKVRASMLAADGSRFAYTGQSGTGLVGLTTETRMTPSGRRFNFLGLGLALIGGLLAASGLLFDMVGMSFRAKGASKKSRKTLLDPNPDLVNAFTDGKAVLWVGAGLSAQCGFPSRRTFLNQTLQTADGETWLESKLLTAMYEQLQKGQHEQALDELVETLHYQRITTVQYFKVVYCRFTPLSPCHKIVQRLPVSAAITTNYDGCLEMMGPMWANNVLTLKQGAHRGAAEKDQFFLLRLYGDPRIPAEVKLSRKEFGASIASDSTLGDTLQILFEKKTMFFLGCSAEGLVADLKMMPKVKKTDRKHYAVIGVGSSHWEKEVQILEKEYGIDCVICSEETIATELPKFLGKLADLVEAAKSDRELRGKDVVSLAVKKAASGA